MASQDRVVHCAPPSTCCCRPGATKTGAREQMLPSISPLSSTSWASQGFTAECGNGTRGTDGKSQSRWSQLPGTPSRTSMGWSPPDLLRFSWATLLLFPSAGGDFSPHTHKLGVCLLSSTFKNSPLWVRIQKLKRMANGTVELGDPGQWKLLQDSVSVGNKVSQPSLET